MSGFRIEIEASDRTRMVREKFVKHHGPDLLADLMRDAGLDNGTWSFRIHAYFKASGGTPAVQVRRYDELGVYLWLKPAANDSGTKGTLLVYKESGTTPEDVFKALRVALARQNPESPPDVLPAPVSLDEDETLLVLTAVRETAGRRSFLSMSDFVSETAKAMSGSDSTLSETAHWLEAMESLVDKKLLHDRKTHYELTRNAEQLLTVGQNGVLTNVNGQRPEQPQGTEAGDVLLRARDRLGHLIDVADKVSKLRDQRGKLVQEITECRAMLDDLKRRLDEVTEAEKQETSGIDSAMLATLLEG